MDSNFVTTKALEYLGDGYFGYILELAVLQPAVPEITH